MQLNDKIKELQNVDIDLFYISSGNTKAFKLFVRHITYAETLGYGKIKDNTFIPKKEIYIVDFEKETINIYKKPFKFEKLKFYE